MTVPLLFILFFLPGLLYGTLTGKIKNDRDVAAILSEVIGRLGPYIVLAFFAAQFIATFNQSNLGAMLAIVGGQFLRDLMVDNALLLSCFILMVAIINLLIGSPSAKYAFFSTSICTDVNADRYQPGANSSSLSYWISRQQRHHPQWILI